MTDHSQIPEEIEIKLDLGSFTNYLKLIGFLGQIDEEIHQRNCYFDTEDRLLSKSDWAFRVRTEDDRGLITVKGKSSDPGLAVVRKEIETHIPRNEAEDLIELRRDVMSLDIPPVSFVRDTIGDVALTRLVQFDNTRQCKSFRIGDYEHQLQIDTTRFANGSVNYELELELSNLDEVDTVEQGLRRLFLSLDVPFIRQNETKFVRALESAGLK
jgi:uncharacterized protein YjbK